MAIIFWSEFPEQVDWERVNKEIDFDTEIYVASKNKQDFLGWKKKIKNKKIKIGAWPVLEKKDGYWFSGQTSKECIDKLDEFEDINIKIDVEPRIFDGKYSDIKAAWWGLKWIVNPGKNTGYLIQKINSMKQDNIISGALLPRWIRKRNGQESNGGKNYICYTSMIPMLEWMLIMYYKYMIKRMDKKNYFAIGLTNHGVFGNEKQYKNKDKFIRDLELMKKLNVKNIVIYSIEGIQKKGWLDVVKNYVSSF